MNGKLVLSIYLVKHPVPLYDLRKHSEAGSASVALADDGGQLFGLLQCLTTTLLLDQHGERFW